LKLFKACLFAIVAAALIVAVAALVVAAAYAAHAVLLLLLLPLQVLLQSLVKNPRSFFMESVVIWAKCHNSFSPC